MHSSALEEEESSACAGPQQRITVRGRGRGFSAGGGASPLGSAHGLEADTRASHRSRSTCARPCHVSAARGRRSRAGAPLWSQGGRAQRHCGQEAARITQGRARGGGVEEEEAVWRRKEEKEGAGNLTKRLRSRRTESGSRMDRRTRSTGARASRSA
ncbi:hypothetical protein EYF80_063716 [Liparis tanakae]|uniref:Uncharacterized protein n=1 Tax=Liparis tanakae TaxID=230148 RepID=A0A4Z2EBD1_9TELE|nr:hypothetical protein EYF80_063716 [Liparis tanakae]